MRRFIALLSLFFTLTHLQAQGNCQDNNDTIVGFQRLFGPDPLWAYGADTIMAEDNRMLIYYCDQCKIMTYNQQHKLIWTKDLSTHTCRLLYFNCTFGKAGKKYKGCDVFLQFKNKDVYGLKSKNGKMVSITEDDIKSIIVSFEKKPNRLIVKSHR